MLLIQDFEAGSTGVTKGDIVTGYERCLQVLCSAGIALSRQSDSVSLDDPGSPLSTETLLKLDENLPFPILLVHSNAANWLVCTDCSSL